jgi:hypothetical protein
VAVTRSEEGDRQLYSLIDSPLTGAHISIDFASRILLIISQVCCGWSGGTFRTGFCFKVVQRVCLYRTELLLLHSKVINWSDSSDSYEIIAEAASGNYWMIMDTNWENDLENKNKAMIPHPRARCSL